VSCVQDVGAKEVCRGHDASREEEAGGEGKGEGLGCWGDSDLGFC